jgi:GNAT superfamily N-acetyltransferase
VSRGAGVGGALVAAVEDWARARGAETLVLTSGRQRLEAQRFCESRGHAATGIRLIERLMA